MNHFFTFIGAVIISLSVLLQANAASETDEQLVVCKSIIDQTQLMGLDTNGSAAIGNPKHILGLIFSPDTQVAKDLSIDSIVVFCG